MTTTLLISIVAAAAAFALVAVAVSVALHRSAQIMHAAQAPAEQRRRPRWGRRRDYSALL